MKIREKYIFYGMDDHIDGIEVTGLFTNFRLDEVRLTDSSFAFRRQLVKKYIVEFDLNRLMHTFKMNAGLSSNAEPLGGWESEDGGLRGHFVGHYLSACSKFAFADQDDGLKSKAYEIVDMMELCAKPNGYLSAFEEEKLDTLEFEENRNVWEFALDDDQVKQAKFIPLFRVEEEAYSVYLDFEEDSSLNRRFSFAKDGSSAYEEA